MAARYWLVALARAVVALAAGLAITLIPGHSTNLGLSVFAAFAIMSGALVAVGAALTATAMVRILQLVQGVLGVIAGVIAGFAHAGGYDVLIFTTIGWALLSGIAELVLGLRHRCSEASARDWTLVGGLTIVLGLVYLFIPADHVLAVGLFGAYAVIVGVYLAIAALSLRWAGAANADNTTESHA